ncbi:MAG: hypothetical protein HY023_02595 [Chloroflexi bacterium]|nr:hypothetical protein [Chloroflexota bacterium]
MNLPDWEVTPLDPGLYKARAPAGDAAIFLGLLAPGDTFGPDAHEPLLSAFFNVEYPSASALLLRIERLTVDHSEASATFSVGGLAYRATAYLYPRQDRVALVAFVTTDAQWDVYSPSFDRVLRSLDAVDGPRWVDAAPTSQVFVAGECASILNGLTPLDEAQTTARGGAGWKTLAPSQWIPSYTRDGNFALFQSADDSLLAAGWGYPEALSDDAAWRKFTHDVVSTIDEGATVEVTRLVPGTPKGIVADLTMVREDNSRRVGCVRAIPLNERRVFVVAYIARRENFGLHADAWVRLIASLTVQ